MAKKSKGRDYTVEIVDRVAVMQDNLDSNIRNHPSVIAKPRLTDLVDKAQKHLSKLYSLLAKKM